MPQVMDYAVKFAARWAQIGTMELPPSARREMQRALLSLYISSALGKLSNPARLVGFQISYFQPSLLRYLFREIFVDGSYLFCADSDRPLIFDCGSNIGMSVLFFKKLYPGARIIGFEPDPATFDKLQANIRQNALTDVTVHQCALSDQEGTASFYRDEDEAGSLLMSLLEERIDGTRITVPARRLSTFITEDVDLLKMDIEGAETAVLGELQSSGKLRRIKQMHVEYHHHVDRDRDRLSSTLELLERSGFGYQMAARPELGKLPRRGAFQDIAIYCYRKDDETARGSA